MKNRDDIRNLIDFRNKIDPKDDTYYLDKIKKVFDEMVGDIDHITTKGVWEIG